MSNYSDPERIRQLFSHPTLLPREFKTWMLDQLALGIPDLPFGQALGGRSVQRQLVHDTTVVSVSTTAETSLFSTQIKAGQLATNGQIDIDLYFEVALPDASNSLYGYVKLGGTIVNIFYLDEVFADTTWKPGCVHVRIQAAGAGSQRVHMFPWSGLMTTKAAAGSFSLRGQRVGSSAADMTAEQTLEITAKWGSNGGCSFNKQLVSVNLSNPLRRS